MNDLSLATQRLESMPGGQEVALELKDTAFRLVEQEFRRVEQEDFDPAALQNAAQEFETALKKAITMLPEMENTLPKSRIQAAINIIKPLVLGNKTH